MRTFRIAARIGLFLTGLLLLAAAPVFGQATVGLYFDTPDYTSARIDAAVNAIVPAYLVLKNPAGDYGVKGWELQAEIDGHATFLGWEYEGQVVNIMDPPLFAVGLAEPLPYRPEGVLLASTNLLVTLHLPTDLILKPIHDPSLPGAMAYLGGPDGDEVLPLVTPDGLPIVAKINGSAPGAEVTPNPLEMGDVPVGYHDIQSVTLTNVGGEVLTLVIELADGCPEFSLPTVSGTYLLPEGQSLDVPVQFTPADLGESSCLLSFNNPYVQDVTVNATGREGIVAWEVPDFLYFPEIPVGDTITRSLSVKNIGEVPFDVTLSLPFECTVFAPTEDYGTVTIQPGAYALFLIDFTPEVFGEVTCMLDLGDVAPAVELRGSARGPYIAWHLSPDPLTFPMVYLPGARTATMTFQNFSEIPLMFNVTLADSTSPFTLGQSPLTLLVPEGGSETFEVFFFPTEVGYFYDQILLDLPGAEPVAVSGSATDGDFDCNVVPDLVDFGAVPVGQAQFRYVTVWNTGQFEMIVAPESDSPHFTATALKPAIAPGSSGLVKITFQPQTIGLLSGNILIGGGCSQVACSGLGTTPSWGEDNDLVALYFDPEFTLTEYELPASYPIFTTYLVLHNPSLDTGVTAWECRMAFPSTMHILSVDYGGNVVNVLTPPSFAVGFDVPRPYQPSMLLAEIDMLYLDSALAALSLYPIHTPSLVNQMSYLGADYTTLVPMTTPYGVPEVAWVNADYMVGVELPAPGLTQTSGRVRVSWAVPDLPYDAVHVYRRIGETDAVRLEGANPETAGGEMVFTDPGTGLQSGDRVSYSYALDKSGQEIARSAEIEVLYNGLPPARTRLLANVPNPFNPSTEINFELERPGSARVDIYDVTGRHILSLCNESLGAGPHHRTWTGLDRTGRQVPSGAYYVKLETESGVDHRKIMLLK